MGVTTAVKDKTNVDFNIRYNISNRWTMSEFHFHDSFEINLSLSGGNKFFVSDKIYTVQSGDLFVFSNHDLHKTLVPMDISYERYLIFFKPAYIQELCTPITDLLNCFFNRGQDFEHRIHLNDEQLTLIRALFDRAIEVQKKSGYGMDVYKKMMLAEILITINQFYQLNDTMSVSRQDDYYHKIQPILVYIQQNLDKRLLLDDLATHFYMSKYYLCSVFKRVTGFTVNEYITNRRIMKAREYLKQNFSVSEVGERVGFPNDAHFIRTFKKLMGTTPKQYAKKPL